MPTSKKTTPTKKHASRKKKQIEEVVSVAEDSLWQRTRAQIVKPFKRIALRVRGLLARRPHRSFHPTRRRDYVRSLKLLVTGVYRVCA